MNDVFQLIKLPLLHLLFKPLKKAYIIFSYNQTLYQRPDSGQKAGAFGISTAVCFPLDRRCAGKPDVCAGNNGSFRQYQFQHPFSCHIGYLLQKTFLFLIADPEFHPQREHTILGPALSHRLPQGGLVQLIVLILRLPVTDILHYLLGHIYHFPNPPNPVPAQICQRLNLPAALFVLGRI